MTEMSYFHLKTYFCSIFLFPNGYHCYIIKCAIYFTLYFRKRNLIKGCLYQHKAYTYICKTNEQSYVFCIQTKAYRSWQILFSNNIFSYLIDWFIHKRIWHYKPVLLYIIKCAEKTINDREELNFRNQDFLVLLGILIMKLRNKVGNAYQKSVFK